MTQAANLSVKKSDGTTDVVYTSINPAAGDNSPAIWKNQTVGTTVAQQPELRVTAKAKGDRLVSPGRQVSMLYKWPRSIQNTITGELKLDNGVTITVNVLQSQLMPVADLKEAIYQGLNLAAHAAVKQMCFDGYAPN